MTTTIASPVEPPKSKINDPEEIKGRKFRGDE